jgi:hypothetical protein
LGGISLATRIIQAEMAPLLMVMIDTEGAAIHISDGLAISLAYLSGEEGRV